MSTYRVVETQGSWIVRVEYNSLYGDPGNGFYGFYGPFLTEVEAKDFEEHWAEDSQGIGDVSVLYLNNVRKVDRG